MAFVSFEQVQAILKQCEGKTFLEAMDSVGRSHGLEDGRITVDQDGRVTAIDCFPRIHAPYLRINAPAQVYKAAPEMKAILEQAKPAPSTPQVSETDRMWDLVVLAAQASRYGE